MGSRESALYAAVMAAGGAVSGAAGAVATGAPLSTLVPAVFFGLSGPMGAYALYYYSAVRIPELPAVEWVGAKLRWLDFHDRVLFEKIVRDFHLSPLGLRENVRRACSDIASRGQHVGVPVAFGEQIDRVFHDHPRRLSPTETDYRHHVERLKQLQRPINVLCLSLQPAVAATLLDMKERLGVPLELETGAANGVVAAEWMARGLTDGRPYDLAVLPSSVFFLARQQESGGDVGQAYSLMLPIYGQNQHVIRRSTYAGRCLAPADCFRFLQRSSAEEMIRMFRHLGYSKFRELPYESGNKFELSQLDENEAFVAWPPLNRVILAHWGFRSVYSYRLWMCLYMLEQAFSDPVLRQAFVTTFLASWCHCRDNPHYAIGLIYTHADARANFRRALRCQIGGF